MSLDPRSLIKNLFFENLQKITLFWDPTRLKNDKLYRHFPKAPFKGHDSDRKLRQQLKAVAKCELCSARTALPQETKHPLAPKRVKTRTHQNAKRHDAVFKANTQGAPQICSACTMGFGTNSGSKPFSATCQNRLCSRNSSALPKRNTANKPRTTL